jgi:hypothetical protein
MIANPPSSQNWGKKTLPMMIETSKMTVSLLSFFLLNFEVLFLVKF